jgi:hypothetical protein
VANEADAEGCVAYHYDGDADGWGSTATRCLCAPEDAWSAPGPEDCDDGDGDVSPEVAREVWGNGKDDDCDREADRLRLADHAWALAGDGSNAAAGIALAGVGDVDGDGWDDVAVGDDAYGRDDGTVHLVYGPIAGPLSLADAGTVVNGPHDNAFLGEPVAAAGDVDGDGLDDVLAGASWDSTYTTRGGAVYVLTAPPLGEHAVADVAARLYPREGSAYASAAVGAGDVDGDGFGDVLVGAAAAGGAGAAWLVRGPITETMALDDADARFDGEAGHDDAGRALAGGEDVDGDGLADVVVGAAAGTTEGEGGVAYVIASPHLGEPELALADARIVRTDGLEAFALSLDLADADGDGLADLLVGSAAPSGDPAVFLFLAPFAAAMTEADAVATVTSDEEDGEFGEAVAFVADLSGDGLPDAMAGDAAADGLADGVDHGAVYVFWGTMAGALLADDAAVRLDGGRAVEAVGASIADAGDPDGDGLPDLLLGAPGYASDGAAWLFPGSAR